MDKALEILVPQEARGERLDVFVHQEHPDLSRSHIKKLIEEGHIQLNGKTSKSSRTLKGGEKIAVQIPKPVPLELTPENFPLDILYEDSDLLILNKPAERVVHPGAGIQEGTLVHAILHHCKDLSGIGGKLRPGIVHRLDKGTSGVLVVAKNDRAHTRLSEQFKSREVEKTYRAFVWGTPDPPRGKIDKPLGRDVRDRKKMSPRTDKGREAVTAYRVLQAYGDLSFLEIKPHTGRTHQIRVHLTDLGHPVLGDPTYGKGLQRMASLSPGLQDKVKAYPYQLLHAFRIAFAHPVTGERVDVEAPMREEMVELKKKLDENFK